MAKRRVDRRAFDNPCCAHYLLLSTLAVPAFIPLERAGEDWGTGCFVARLRRQPYKQRTAARWWRLLWWFRRARSSFSRSVGRLMEGGAGYRHENNNGKAAYCGPVAIQCGAIKKPGNRDLNVDGGRFGGGGVYEY